MAKPFLNDLGMDLRSQIVGAVANPSGRLFGAFNPAASDGAETAAGISAYRVVTTAGSTVKSGIIARDAICRQEPDVAGGHHSDPTGGSNRATAQTRDHDPVGEGVKSSAPAT
jgi:hypothetical protein